MNQDNEKYFGNPVEIIDDKNKGKSCTICKINLDTNNHTFIYSDKIGHGWFFCEYCLNKEKQKGTLSIDSDEDLSDSEINDDTYKFGKSKKLNYNTCLACKCDLNDDNKVVVKDSTKPNFGWSFCKKCYENLR